MRGLVRSAILCGMVFLVQIGPGAWSVCAQTPEEQAAAQAKQLMEQAVIFRLEHLGEAAASLAALAGASYVEEAFLTDPWGQPFEYAASGGPQRELAIWSRGPGGTGGFAPGNPGQFTGEAVGYSTASGRYVQGR